MEGKTRSVRYEMLKYRQFPCDIQHKMKSHEPRNKKCETVTPPHPLLSPPRFPSTQNSTAVARDSHSSRIFVTVVNLCALVDGVHTDVRRTLQATTKEVLRQYGGCAKNQKLAYVRSNKQYKVYYI